MNLHCEVEERVIRIAGGSLIPRTSTCVAQCRIFNQGRPGYEAKECTVDRSCDSLQRFIEICPIFDTRLKTFDKVILSSKSEHLF